MSNTKTRRKAANFTIDENILREAKELGLNASRAAEEGLEKAIRKVREDQWLKNNMQAIETTNARIEKQGTLLKPIWAK